MTLRQSYLHVPVRKTITADTEDAWCPWYLKTILTAYCVFWDRWLMTADVWPAVTRIECQELSEVLRYITVQTTVLPPGSEKVTVTLVPWTIETLGVLGFGGLVSIYKNTMYNELKRYCIAVNGIFRDTATECHLPYGITHPTQVNTPRLNPSHTGRYPIYLPRRDGRLSWPSWLDSALAESQTSDLSITSPTLNHCTSKTTVCIWYQVKNYTAVR